MLSKSEFIEQFKRLAEYHDKKLKDAVLSFYYEKLGHYSYDAFKSACSMMKTTKKVGQFPTVAELEESCKELERERRREYFSSSMTEWESKPEDIQFGKDCLRLIYAISELSGEKLDSFKREWFLEMNEKYSENSRAMRNISSLQCDIYPNVGEIYVQDVDF